MSILPNVHLVGSVAMKDSESVFRALSGELKPWLKRIPDGETGERYHWVLFQRKMLLDHPAIELDPDAPMLPIKEWTGRVIRETELVHFKPGTDISKVEFETGYAPAAIASYQTFRKLRDQGVIAKGARFQVALPTPMSSGYMYVSPTAHEDYFQVYERSLLKALSQILAAIPAQDLAIQWDICQEVLVFENYFPWRPDNYKAQIFTEMARLGDAVPAGVEMGYHMCYGSPKDVHLVQPKDTAIMVEILNGAMAGLKRRLDFVHLPVPQDRDDDAYFAPLAALKLPAETEIYLGLIHFGDDDGNMRRAKVAERFVAAFGLATECGWGRTDPERVPGLITAHRTAMERSGAKAL